MNTPPPETPPPETDDEFVDLAEIEAGPTESAQWRAMLPAAIAGTAAMLVWRFFGVRMFDENPAVSDTVRIGLTILVATFVAAYPVWIVWRHGQHLFERPITFLDLLLEGAIAFGVLLGVMGFNIVVGLLWQLVSNERGGMPEQLEELAFSEDRTSLLLLGAMACIWAPISEELFFRRLLQRALQGRMRLWLALILQAVLFTIMHDYQGVHIVLIFTLGMALGGLYAWRGTILSSMMLHGLQNTGVTILLGLLMWGTSRAPVLGIEMQNAENGVEVVNVLTGSAAEDAGLQPGDVITEMRLGGMLAVQPGMPNQPVPDTATLKIMLMFQAAGDEVQLTVERGDEELDITATLQSRQDLELDEEEPE